MFKATRSQQVDDGAQAILTDLLPKLDIAEVMVTDEYGYNAVTTSPSSDFVQSDEGWWQTAWANGSTTAQATADAATQRTVVELAGVDSRRQREDRRRESEVRSFDGRLGARAGQRRRQRRCASISSTRSARSSRARRRHAIQAVRGFAADRRRTTGRRRSTSRPIRPSTARAVVTTNGGRWRVDRAHERGRRDARLLRRALGAARRRRRHARARSSASLMLVGRFIERRITGPARELAIAAEAVAAGDLSKQVNRDRRRRRNRSSRARSRAQ